MSGSPIFTKDPNAILDFTVDWTTWLNGDTISTSVWTVTGAGVTTGTATSSTTAGTLWISTSSDNTDYFATNRIVTAAGRVNEQTITIKSRQQ